ncbi:HET-domain-containing protein [Thelonectria olida]|uniref:HET-domain-containing protein n=1 Tax=Thelonectria olida TaxID=1576542 RepID=A0A9P8W3A4_9HYPO|nr:HET-domain-containing protein [Thelonectria olida]
MAANLCSVCRDIFRGKQRLAEDQPHHRSKDDYLTAAKQGCYICCTITDSKQWKSVEIQHPPPQPQWYLTTPRDAPPGFLRLTIDTLGDEPSQPPDERSMHSSDVVEPFEEFMLDAPAWTFSLVPASDAGDLFDYKIPTEPLHHPDSLHLSQSWFETCCRDHISCRPPNPDFRPTRLVQIINDKEVKVILPSQTACGPYVAFSHCWGKAKTLKLLQSNLAQLCSGIQVTDLPESYKEAIRMCRGLKLDHIWIDSLCIIQDSVDDWRREAAMMKDVYGNCILNLCASAAAENSETSFRARVPGFIPPFEVHLEWDGMERQRYYLTDSEMYMTEILESPLRSRAWVLQEVYLSKRSLSLTRRQIWWECRQNLACETFPGGVPMGLIRKDVAESMQELTRQTAESQAAESTDVSAIHSTWISLVERYTQCGLTVLSDRMMAFSGIAQMFPEHRNMKTQYMAGVWRTQLPLALMWSTVKIFWTYRPDTYRAPSWSWASVEGGLTFAGYAEAEEGDWEAICTVANAEMHLLDPNHETGLLKGGVIEINGHLMGPCTMDQDSALTYYSDSSNTPLAELQAADWATDETTKDATGTASYLDKLNPTLCRRGIVDGAIRVKLSLEDAKDRLYCLPIMKRTRGGEVTASGLVLFQPKHQKGVFQRVGEFSNMPLEQGTLSRFQVQGVLLV